MSAENKDPYWKLRPSTPVDALCRCVDGQPIVLQPHFSENPISCLRCNLEVPPERIGFSEALAEKLACWQTFHHCFYYLWLDSGEFEEWAWKHLEDPNSAVHTRGFELVKELNKLRRTYYWWPQDSGAEGYIPLTHCPRCQNKMVEEDRRLLCTACSILVAMDD